MGVTANWDNEARTVIRYDFQGRWDWNDFRAATNDAFALTRSVPHQVDTISYFHDGATVPSNALLMFNRAMRYAPTNRGVTVIVGGTPFINNLVSIFSKVYKPLGKKLFLASSLNEARKKLSAMQNVAVAQPALAN